MQFLRSATAALALAVGLWVGLALGATAPAAAQSPAVRFYAVDGKNLCIDIAGGKMVPGTIVRLWGCNNAPAQRFGLDPQRGLIYATANPNLCVDDIPGKGLALVDCRAVRLSWVFDPARYEIRGSDGRCWDVPSGRFLQCIRLIIWRCHGGAPQRFGAQA